MAERLLTAQLEQAFQLDGIEITSEQWRVLFYLWNEDGINQRELAKRVKKEKSTITRQIDTLERKGLIERHSLNEDKRNKQLFVTQQGKIIEERTLHIAQSITEKAEASIHKTELKIFRKVLQQMILNIEQM